MYASPQSTWCPVKLLKLRIDKKKKPRKESTSLFNQYYKDAIPQTDKGYPQNRFLIVNRIFSKFLNEICKAAGVETNYTPTA